MAIRGARTTGLFPLHRSVTRGVRWLVLAGLLLSPQVASAAPQGPLPRPIVLRTAVGVAPNGSPTPAPSPSATNAAAPDEDVSCFGPTVTDGTNLSALGRPEFEIFYQVQHNAPDFSRQRLSRFTVKYTFTQQLMLSVGSDGDVRSTSAATTVNDFADPELTLKYLYRPPRPGKDSQALQLAYKPPFGDPARGINTGQHDYVLTWLYSRDIGDVGFDFNLQASDLGATDGSRRLIWSQMGCATVPITETLSYAGEVYHYGGNGPIGSVLSTLHGLTWNVAPRYTLAAAVDIGLNANAPRIGYIFGGGFCFGRAGVRGCSPVSWRGALGGVQAFAPRSVLSEPLGWGR